MIGTNVQRLGRHVTAALLGQVTIVAGGGGARGHAPTATLAAGAAAHARRQPGTRAVGRTTL